MLCWPVVVSVFLGGRVWRIGDNEVAEQTEAEPRSMEKTKGNGGACDRDWMKS